MMRARGTTPRRISVAIAVTLALVGGLLTLGAAPASAAVTVLCTGYDQCAKRDRTNHGYEAASDNLYWRMFGGHNCTNYVAYRLVQAGMPNVRPWTGGADGRYWGGANKAITDKVPVKGAVAWWDSNANGHGSSGHVAYVEKVISSTEIIVSEDNWQGNFFYKRITKSGTGWPSGFVHLRDSRTPLAPLYSATKVSQNFWTNAAQTIAVTPSAMRPGQTAVVEVRYRNTGRTSWSKVQLGTQEPENRKSALAASNWKAPDRAATQREAVVKPGGIATFRFHVTVPAGATDAQRWVERFAPVLTTASGASTWMTTSPTSLVVVADAGKAITPTRPRIAGAAREGTTLTSKTGPWLPADSALSFQWKRNGVAISGARSKTYTLTDADVGTRVSLAVTGKKSGFITSVQTSTSSGVVRSLASNVLRPGARLKTGLDIVSKNGRYRFVQLKEGDARIYDRLSGIPLWSTAVYGKYLYTTLSVNGSLVTRNSKSIIWSSKTTGKKAVRAVLSDKGVLTLTTKKGKTVWSSRTSGK